jgi:DNA-binding transcriptional LysR family regulator
MGISVVPSVAVEADLAAGRIVTLPWRPTFEVYTQLVWNARRSLSPAHVAFQAAARDVFAAKAAADNHEADGWFYDAPAGAELPRATSGG